MNKYLYIAHGYNANSQKHWFKWLTQHVPSVDSKILDFPNSSNPILSDWTDTLKAEVDLTSGENVIVAHSLGVVTVLNYLSKYEGKLNIKGLVLVAGFYEEIPELSKLDDYIQYTNIDFEKLKEKVPNIISIIATNDRVVPYKLSENLAKKLNSEFVTIEHDGHFCDRDGYISFPEVASYVNRILNQ